MYMYNSLSLSLSLYIHSNNRLMHKGEKPWPKCSIQPVVIDHIMQPRQKESEDCDAYYRRLRNYNNMTWRTSHSRTQFSNVSLAIFIPSLLYKQDCNIARLDPALSYLVQLRDQCWHRIHVLRDSRVTFIFFLHAGRQPIAKIKCTVGYHQH
jgi:hypothetical protein